MALEAEVQAKMAGKLAAVEKVVLTLATYLAGGHKNSRTRTHLSAPASHHLHETPVSSHFTAIRLATQQGNVTNETATLIYQELQSAQAWIEAVTGEPFAAPFSEELKVGLGEPSHLH